MSFKACFWNVFDILVLFHPLVLSSCFQVLRNLEIFNRVNECIFDKDDINVLEMNFVGLALVGLDFIGLQDV
jgi:hypothetical protein